MLTRVLLAAILVGVCAGLFYTAVLSFRVIPLILEAERYETLDAPNNTGGHSHEAGTSSSNGAAAEPWMPANGMERLFYTGLANIVVGIAFSLILTAAVLVLDQRLTLQSGMVWGLAGFVVFTLAPNFGLPPELPGMQAAAVLPRQIWWITTVMCSALALGLFAFKHGAPWIVAGVVLMLAPHLYGAPQPASHESSVPANLAVDFAMATVVSSALFWLVLGGLLGVFMQRAMKQEEAENNAK